MEHIKFVTNDTGRSTGRRWRLHNLGRCDFPRHQQEKSWNASFIPWQSFDLAHWRKQVNRLGASCFCVTMKPTANRPVAVKLGEGGLPTSRNSFFVCLKNSKEEGTLRKTKEIQSSECDATGPSILQTSTWLS